MAALQKFYGAWFAIRPANQNWGTFLPQESTISQQALKMGVKVPGTKYSFWCEREKYGEKYANDKVTVSYKTSNPKLAYLILIMSRDYNPCSNKSGERSWFGFKLVWTSVIVDFWSNVCGSILTSSLGKLY